MRVRLIEKLGRSRSDFQRMDRDPRRRTANAPYVPYTLGSRTLPALIHRGGGARGHQGQRASDVLTPSENVLLPSKLGRPFY